MMMMPASLSAVTTLSTSIAIKNLCFQLAVCLREGRWFWPSGLLAIRVLSCPVPAEKGIGIGLWVFECLRFELARSLG